MTARRSTPAIKMPFSNTTIVEIEMNAMNGCCNNKVLWSVTSIQVARCFLAFMHSYMPLKMPHFTTATTFAHLRRRRHNALSASELRGWGHIATSMVNSITNSSTNTGIRCSQCIIWNRIDNWVVTVKTDCVWKCCYQLAQTGLF